MDPLPLIVTVVSVSVGFLIYLVTKFFTIKEYSEKKRKGMFDWVSSNLFDEVYEPLKTSAEEVSTVLNPHGKWEEANEEYRKDVLLFCTANFLHYAYKNHDKVGNYIFLTQYDLSNDYLCRLSEKIISEFKEIYAESVSVGGNMDESTVIKLDFLATSGTAKSYPIFKSLIKGYFFPYPLQVGSKRGENFIDFWKEEIAILEKIKLLKRAYSGNGYLSREDSENYSKFVDMIGKILNENDHEERWKRAKLYAYCALFHKLLSYELHRMYDSWYVGYQKNINLNELFYTLDRVFEITESVDRYQKLCAEYRKLCDREWDIENALDNVIAIINGFTKDNSNAQNEIARLKNQQSELEKKLEEIRKKKEEIHEEKEKIRFTESDEEISALYDISLDKNKLFDDKKRSKITKKTNNQRP
jgi:hypothetical protein